MAYMNDIVVRGVTASVSAMIVQTFSHESSPAVCVKQSHTVIESVVSQTQSVSKSHTVSQSIITLYKVRSHTPTSLENFIKNTVRSGLPSPPPPAFTVWAVTLAFLCIPCTCM